MKFKIPFLSHTSLVLKCHMWLLATILQKTDVEHFNYCRKFNWTVLVRL